MRTRKLVSLFLSLVLVLTLSAAVFAEEAPLTVIDMKGREVTLAGPVTRLVVLEPSDCEILAGLGADSLIIGRGAYCDLPSVADATVVQSGYDTNIEEIIALAPDLVIMNTMNQSLDEIAQLEAAGIPVLSCASTDIAGVYENIRCIGAAVSKGEEAEALVAAMQEVFAAVGTDKEALAGKTVYFEVSPLEWGLWTAGSGTFMDEVAALIGLENIFHGVEGWAEVSEEQVIALDPDYIVTITMYYGEGLTPEEEIAARPAWAGIRAVKNGAILNLTGNELSHPSPLLADGARLLCEFVTGR